MTEPASLSNRRRGMLGFYVAMGALLALAVASGLAWTPVRTRYREDEIWRRQRAAVDAMLQDLDRPATVGLKSVSARNALAAFVSGHIFRASTEIHLDAAVTLQFEKAPVGAVLTCWCRQVNADWTIAPNDYGLGPRQEVVLVVGDRAYVAGLDTSNPRIAQLVRDYKRKLAAEAGEAAEPESGP